uniref:monoacylglycerol lipase-like n=1 Tax=Erigeron canadensis TaxID=72917 RepID=UPI001CB98AFA|nr:monoacylglycerol lipase-like [Erigeron canadensis]
MQGKEVMLTSGASGRVNALLSMQVLKSLLMLVSAFLLLLFYPFRARKARSSPPSCVVAPGKEEQVVKGVRVPAVVPWKSSANVVVDQEVAARRAMAIKKVMENGGGGGDVCRREYSLFVTPRGDTMFTQSWTPVSVKPRALVILLHGLNEHSGRYDEFAKQLNAHGYKVYGMDWVGHGGSDGLHAYVHSLEDAVTDVKAFIKHVMSENTGLPCFCFGHSTGGAIVLKAALDPKIEKSLAGIVLTSPAVGVQPTHPIFLILAPIFSLLLPKFQLSAANKTEAVVSRDPAALIAKYSDPLVYTGSIRVRTGHEILRITSYLQRNAHKLKVPFFVLHGGADAVTDPNASLKLYELASSEDKSIKLLPQCLHDLLFEPEQKEIKRDIIDWLNSRV